MTISSPSKKSTGEELFFTEVRDQMRCLGSDRSGGCRSGFRRESERCRGPCAAAASIVGGRLWPKASSRRAYTAYATPCSSFSPTCSGRSSSKSYSRSRSGSRNCAWGPPPPAAGRQPAAVQRLEDESRFSMVPPLGHVGALSNYHRPRRGICPQQSNKLPVFGGPSRTNPRKPLWGG